MANTIASKYDVAKLSATKKILFAAIATVAPVAVLAAIGEIALRWWEPPVPASLGVVVRRTSDPEKPYELLPNSTGVIVGAPVSINSLGCRDREYSRAKPPGVVRIVGIGDSLTFGQGVREEETYLSRLEEKFASRTVPTEVINCGVFGYNVNEEARRFQEVVESLDPDVVIIGYELGDIMPNPKLRTDAPGLRGVDHRVAPLVERRGLATLLKKSRLVTFLAYRYSFLLKKLALRNWDSLYSEDNPLWKNLRAKYATMAELAQAKHIDLVVAIIPELSNLDEGYPFRAVHDRVAKMCAALGIHAVDLRPAFSGLDGPTLWVHPQDRHPNARGHQIIADALEDPVARILNARATAQRVPPSSPVAREYAAGEAKGSR